LRLQKTKTASDARKAAKLRKIIDIGMDNAENKKGRDLGNLACFLEAEDSLAGVTAS
jgi:hypothetical protein